MGGLVCEEPGAKHLLAHLDGVMCVGFLATRAAKPSSSPRRGEAGDSSARQEEKGGGAGGLRLALVSMLAKIKISPFRSVA